MFSIKRSLSPSSQDSDDNLPTPDTISSSSASSISEHEYPARSFPGYAEKPLEEQLEPIAVVGMGCRLPGDVHSPSEFWDLLMRKGTGQTPKVPASRFNIDAHIHSNNDRPGSFGVLGGYFLKDDLADFDPGLFGMTPIEAMWMDPQQRKLLEVVYEALESGGISLEKISGTRTAVFAASFTADWQQMAFKEHSFRHSLAATGVDPGIISNRISHVFNLNGPSIMCNTACSSSVYALHNACNALRNYETEGAIVGGVNLIITVDQHMNTAKLGVLSPTSTCHTFDASADGYGRADAVGAVYLKRLSDAVRDGDPVRGVIRSSATNSNGKVPAAGITHPNRDGQAKVIAAAYERGGDLDPRLTGYFECHGTGTAVGDPLEVHAVSMAMNKERKPGNPLIIGAVKPNIGHSEAASGLSALIKAIMVVERGMIPATRGVVKPSPAIKWEDWNVTVPTDAVPFPAELPVRRVSINSFGYGGTNAHIIVENTGSLTRNASPYSYLDSWTQPRVFTSRRRVMERRRPFLLPFSAHDKATLRRNIDAHGKVVTRYNLLDLSYTLSTRRSVLNSKAFTVASYSNLSDVFHNVSDNFSFADKKSIHSIGFVFTGQGAQWARMGAELLAYSPIFLGAIRDLDLALEELSDSPKWSIEDILLEAAESSPVEEAEFSQPLCTAVQIALVKLLESWGIRPAVTVGHSSGEIAAAYAAGLISADEGIVAAYYRGQVAKDVHTSGAMMAVGLSAETVETYLTATGVVGKVVVACYNSPLLVTLSGDADAMQIVKSKLDAAGVFARAVKTNGKAYHSHHMAPVAELYEKLMLRAKAQRKAGRPLSNTTKMVSSVTNTLLPEGTALDHTYWSANLRSPVLFNQAVQAILKSGELNVDYFIEIGPHSALAGPIKQIKAEVKADNLDYTSTLLRNKDSAAQLLNVAGELFLRGYPVNMEKVSHAYMGEITASVKPAKGCTIVDLPTYQWNYTRPLWAESRSSREQRLPKFPRHDVLGQVVIGSSLAEPTWRNVLRIRDLPWLRHHHLGGESVFPAAGYFAMAIEAIRQINELSAMPVPIKSYVLRDVSIKTALVTPDDDDGIEVLFNMRPSVHGSAWWDWSVSSVDMDGVKKDHMSGSISINTRNRRRAARPIPQFTQRATGKAWNRALREVGFDYGLTFQDIDDVRFDGKQYQAACATNIKQVVDENMGESRYVLHPASIDSTLQLCIAAIYAGRTEAMDCGVVPVQVDEVTLWPPTKQQLQTMKASAYAVVHRRGMRTSESSVQMTAEDGEMVMDIVNMRATAYEAAVPQKVDSALEYAPYGGMAWKLDIDTVEDRDGMETAELVHLALFKYPGLKVVEAGAKNAAVILSKHPHASYTIIATQEEAEAANTAVSGFHNASVHIRDSSGDIISQGLKKESYDMLIADEESPLATQLGHLLKAGSFKIGSNVRIASQSESKCVPEKLSVQLIYHHSPTVFVPKVRAALEALNWEVTVASLNESAKSNIAEHVVMLADFEGPLLFSLEEKEFSAIQKIVANTSSLLWVSTGAILDGKKPEYAMASGLSRAITSEQASLDFRTLDVDIDNTESATVVNTIAKIVQLQAAMSEKTPEREFCLSHGKTYISRLVRNNNLNSLYSSSNKPEPKLFMPGDRITGKILKGKVVFQQNKTVSALQHNCVEVQIQCSGLTKESTLVFAGSDYASTFSHEIGGVVTRIGPGVLDLRPGDRVVGFNTSCMDSYQQVPAAMLQKLDQGDNMNHAVSTIMAYATALHSLETLAAVKENEIVLILSNTGFAGIAAIKTAQLKGAIPIVLVETGSEVEFLRQDLGLNADHVILASNGPVSEQLNDLTNGHGVDVVFSAGSVDTSVAREAWRHIAPFGRFVDSGRKNNLSRNVLDGLPIQRGASYMPFDILDICESRPEQFSKLLPIITDYSRRKLSNASGTLRHMDLADIDQAVTDFSDAFGATKPVVQYRASDKLIRCLPFRSNLQFSPDATYLLVGCLGGLGRSLTSWMLELGARRFTFLCRSGADSSSAADLVLSLEAAGAMVQVVRGDVTSQSDVIRAINGISSKYPIKGVVHAAMVLRDSLYHSMTFEAWKQSVLPKVAGAWNLHSVLASTPLDFFIMTSSVSGILGTPGQANYAAANAYLDALARHRMRCGSPAISVVLPMVLGVGVVAENAELEDGLARKGMYGVDEEHLIQSFEAAIVSQKLEQPPDHVVVGLDPVRLQKAVNDPIATDSFWCEDPRFSHAVLAMNSSAEANVGDGGKQSILDMIRAAASMSEAIFAVNEHFVDKLARMLMLGHDDVDPEVGSIASYGIDSMIGAELRNWIFKEFKLDIPFQQLLGPSLTIAKFAAQVCMHHGVKKV
ncbi:KR domain-containing protein [Xylaria scruposa]|nr:KR domain-containing protein [Xylaria scruposa]